ncbi:MAG: PASTA domain-containing protein [Candidatus Cloacimonetes bacterium]|nr:PASTA domain-containing protein [Candidatus Cloacimonadota bacterium]MCF7813911.1 PASTA domain-containing protein [Candidatus Cloacimonadota bacterium]MCF7868508.1 PASTA domain-containing protein [Candidatus Cloacimonadota bacterium]MCF7884023.1 PASTA domain-containing protein [Candidatus Cloacimonadota bacterium]
MKKKIQSFFIAVSILVVIFIAGFFLINFVMKLIVGHGNEVKVPNLVNMNYNVAQKLCNENNLYLHEAEVVNNDEVEKGHIISQNPHPNIMTKRFRTVDVVVSNGPEMVRIPFLYNLTVVEAKLKLENAGLNLGKKIYRYSDDVEEGKVVYSQPIADELIAKRSQVDVIVSLGKYSSSSSSNNKWKNLLQGED